MSSFPPPSPATATAQAPLSPGAGGPGSREFRIPVHLLEHVGSVAGPGALEAAGAAAGRWLASLLRETLGSESLATTPHHAFWEGVDALLRERGWGRWRETRAHPGVAVVVVEDPPEGPAQGAWHPSDAPFLRSLLQALLREAGGEGLEVISLPPENPTELPLVGRFAFGPPAATRALAAALAGGLDEDHALAAL
jgi:hypothetical protein